MPHTLDPHRTALILIDLQEGIVSLPTAPRSGAEVVAASKIIAERFRHAGAVVVLVNVAFAADGKDALSAPVDKPLHDPNTSLPAHWAELVPDLAREGDLRVTKHQWGAFYGTDLDLQLRRRGINTIVLGGIATNMGVESTARAAHEHGYHVIILEDLTAGLDEEMHHFAFQRLFPHLARIRQSNEIQFP
ncbi:hydrolase [Parasaccharibacter apium]|nr:hydrolase [Parasaccharibacter apium]